MIELGHPFSRPFQDLIDALEDSIRDGVEQPATIELLFRSGTPSYEIAGPVEDVSRVTGLVRRAAFVFERGVHYRYASGRLVWNEPPEGHDGAWFPDDSSRVTVEYTFRDPASGLTDFNAGSVAGTLVRAVSRELKLLYEQMDQAYRRAFIDIAQGVALDNVVALLGIVRHPALPARGEVTFFLKKPIQGGRPVVIAPRTRVADAKNRVFVVSEGGAIQPTAEEVHIVTGTATTTVRTIHRIGALTYVRARGSAVDLVTAPVAPGAPFGPDERTIVVAGVAAGSDVTVAYQPKSVTVPVTAQEPGPDGNLGTGSITVMPTPPRGVDGGVTNELALTGGEAAESDDQLRERAKHALERAGHATLNAIQFAILDVEGVEGVEVHDHTIDDTIPLGEVRVRYSGGDGHAIQQAIEDSRAAGILVRAEAVTTVHLSGTFYVIPDGDFAADSTARFRDAVVAALGALAIGEALHVRRLTALAFQIPGLADVAEAQLTYTKQRPGGAVETGAAGDPFLAAVNELIRPDAAQLAVVALPGLSVSGSHTTAGHRTDLEVRLVRDGGGSVTLSSLALGITVIAKARLKTAPDQPPQRIFLDVRTAQFTGSDTATLSISDAQLASTQFGPGFQLGPNGHDPHVEFQVLAAAYPALKPGIVIVDVTGIA